MKQTTTSTKATMLPAFVGDVVETLNTSARILRKTAQGVERVVDGIDEIATLSLQQKKQQLLAELK